LHGSFSYLTILIMKPATKMVLLTARFVKESYGHVKSYSVEAKIED